MAQGNFKTHAIGEIKMDGPDIFRNIDPSRISRSKAEETLLYVRYLLNREKENTKIRLYESLKVILEARLEELTERQMLPPITPAQRIVGS
jgi:hypothetical protein